MERLRIELDAAFPQLSNGVAEAFAQSEDRRSILRVLINLAFTGGVAVIPATPLKRYLDDATLIILDVDGSPIPINFQESYADYLRVFDTRLAYWTVNGATAYAKTPVDGLLTNYDGDAQFNCIAQPPVPAADEEYESITGGSLDDMTPQLIDAGITFMLGQSEHMASETA